LKIHPCEIKNGGCSHRCARIKGFKAACLCPVTHKLQPNKKTCVNKLCLEKDAIKFDGNSGASSRHDPKHSADRAFKVQGAKQWPWANKRGQFPATVYHKFANGGTIRPNKISFTTRTNAGFVKTQAPKTFKIVASNDCKTWTTLLRVNSAGFTKDGQTKAWDIPCGKKVALYKCVGIQVLKPNGGPHVSITNIKMWGEQVTGVHPCDIKNGILKNGGCQRKCKKVGSKAVCLCPTTHKLAADKKKCLKKHPCEIKKGGCSHKCERNGAKPECKCPATHRLGGNKKTCVKKHPCEIKNFGCSHKCNRRGNNAFCSCPPKLKLAGNKKKCIPKHPCEIKNGGCSHKCARIKGGKAACRCPPSHKLSPKDKKTCIKKHPCEIKNGGCSHTCKRDGLKRVCQCPAKHKLGKNKRTCLKIHPCEIKNGGCSHRCARIKGFKAACLCPVTHKLQPNKKTCVNKLCLEKDAIKFDGNSGASSRHDPKHSADRAFKVQGAKQWPWANKRGQFPATVYHKFANGGTIRPNKISFTTRTNAGFVKTQAPKTFKIVASNDCKTWTTLLRVNSAGFTKDGQTKAWDIPCGKKVALYKCVGIQVLKPNGGPHVSITNIKMWGEQVTGVHPCDIKNGILKNGGCQRKCKKVGSKAVCLCPTTHKLAADKKKCLKKHPCEIKKGGCSHKCERNGAKPECKCPATHRLGGNKKTCVKKHPCEIKNFGCSHKCNRRGNNAFCSCPAGLILAKNKKRCIQDPAKKCARTAKIDLQLIVDTSGSVGSTNFRIMMTKIADNLVEQFAIGSSKTRVALTIYDHRVFHQFDLTKYKTKSSLKAAIKRTPFKGKNTKTGQAMLQTFPKFVAKQRKNAAKVLMVFTDGKTASTDKPNLSKAQKQWAANGATIYAIGIGTGIQRSELNVIAGDPKKVQQPRNFNELDKTADIVIADVCKKLDEKIKCAKSAKIDMHLLVDTSGSVGKKNFGIQMQKIADAFVEEFEIGPAKTRVALTLYDSKAHHKFDLITYKNKDDLQKAIKKVGFVGKSTLTAKGMNAALKHFDRFDRNDAKKVLVVFTDGESQDKNKITAAYRAWANKGATVFAIGIGKGIKRASLRQIAGGDDSKVLQSPNFNVLGDLARDLLEGICSVKPPPRPPAIGTCFQFPANKPKSHVKIFPLNDQKINDFTVDMRLKFTKKTSSPFFMTAFKGSGNADQLAVGLAGIWTKQSHRLKAKLNIKEGQYYRFTFSRKGAIYSIYINGKLHLQKSSGKYQVPSKAAWVLGQEQDKTHGGFDKNQRFIGNLCEFRMWNKGFTSGRGGADAFFSKKPAAFGKPSLFDFPISYRYEVKDGAKGPPHPCDKNKGKGPCSHECSTVGKNAVCSCPSGLKLAANKRTCVKPHPCDVNKGGCNHICNRSGKNAVCACRGGHALLLNRKTCKKIPSGFVKKSDGFYYKYYSGARTWDQAQGECQRQGGNLAIIFNDRTSRIVFGMMRHGWIGGNDKRREGQWRTPTTPWNPARWSNKPIPWKNWSRGEPNNAGNEDCIHQLTTRKWNDLSCGSKQPFICQIKYWS